jgi:PIN domain nuclease of toxin-antitoxin system
VNYLLDTHAFIFWMIDDPRLSRRARAVVSNAQSAVFLSAASAWEIATKVRIGKLPEGKDLLSDLPLWLAEGRIQELPISLAHAQKAGLWLQPHRDPFDRMLAAQAQMEEMTLVTNDEAIEAFGISTLW